MLEIQEKIHSVSFINGTDINPTAENISYLMPALSKRVFLPTTFQEMSPEGINFQPRLRFLTQDNEWVISFLSNRIDIEKYATPQNQGNLGPIEDFCVEASEYLEIILNHFNKKPSRLTLATNDLLNDYSQDKLEEIFFKLSKPIPFYENKPPFEWGAKYASRIGPIIIGDKEETLNVNTTATRYQGHMLDISGVKQFDKIALIFDINTIAENSDYRFTSNMIPDFFKQAIDIRKQLIEQFEALVNG